MVWLSSLAVRGKSLNFNYNVSRVKAMKVGPKLDNNTHYIKGIKVILVWNSLTRFAFQYCAKPTL
jgi:hypothetical protein